MTAKAICRVMNVPIDTKTARSKRMVRVYDGKTYFLCCKTCVTLFDKNPNQYASQRASSR
jgi:YHS domain-containing protein